MLYKVGYIDDEYDTYEDFRDQLEKKDIELLFPEECVSEKDIIEWIQKENIKCFLVDHKLKMKYRFLGTELIRHIHSKMPDLPCIILTNNKEDSVSENIVIAHVIEEKSIMNLSNEKYPEFIEKIKQATKVFETTIKNYVTEYEQLLKMKETNALKITDEERLQDLHRRLREYGEVDDIPAKLLDSKVSSVLDSILKNVNELIDKVDER